MARSEHEVHSDPGAVATQRLFFALWPAQDLQRQWHQQAESMLVGVPGRRVAAHNLHLTLVFLGAVSEAVRQCLERAVADIRSTPFTLALDRVGYWHKPQVVWLGCAELPAPLGLLAHTLKVIATDCGLAPDTQTFSPHLTVARKVRAGPEGFLPTPLIWPVKGFALVESLSQPHGVHYRLVRMWDM